MSWLSKATGIHINPIKGEYHLDSGQLLKAGLIGGGLALGAGALGLGSALGTGAAGAAGAGAAGAAGAGAAGAAGAGALGGWGVPLAIGGSSLLGAYSAQKAAETQAEAQRQANELQYQQYLQSRQDLLPYAQAGLPATNALLTGLGIGGDTGAAGYGQFTKPFSMADYQQDPGYQFRLQEGLKQLQGKAAARGGALSGATLKGVQGYAQGLASQEYGNAYDRYIQQQQNRYNMLAEQQRLGANAAAGQATQAANYGTAGAAGLTNIGAAQAAGQMGTANAIAGGVQNMLDYYGNKNLADTIRKSTYGG